MKKQIKKALRQSLGILTLSFLFALMPSCKKYLEAKPDGKLTVPQTLTDFQAILDAAPMSNNYPSAGDIGSDYYYLSDNAWQTISLIDMRNDYIWDANAANDYDWLYMYTMILNANIVIDGAGKVPADGSNLADRNRVLGAGYFFRGYDHYALTGEFEAPYIPGGDNSGPGLPLKLKADITDPTKRSSIRQTFSQIIADLKTAAALLPVDVIVKSRPSKAAAFGALARVYLTMGDFRNANLYADSCLQLSPALIDYNRVSATAPTPFKIFNEEVVFHNASAGRGSVFSTSREMADTSLLASYDSNDLRKAVFFKPGASGSIFKGDYGGSKTPVFAGIAADEMYLVRAETAVRTGNVSAGIGDLNTLLAKRFASNTFVPYNTGMDADAALRLVLSERRKELPYRSGLRWNDLRRLNQEPGFAKSLSRNLGGVSYTLPPGDKRYTFLIPVSVVQQTGIAQNPR
ncbi:RagB/SusD family nutrient uptake outer membrane protein [Mucilaginibacter sp.]|jgi:hypothetical protein|uniref:RagB/SusD family nutrient uptake outer membrane protein n=1 Tax=Mucilaginibacter sp. TaxID=1882438 RepID=UPI002CF5ACBF|nr:RagB/SusD family nutrient uptake outer membrane protein [Mucilaginibacter sp.]HTI58990.1 RagB/SusD family nutrient uptake outer membrane protein [Mucilaginibacter sp.]